MTVFALLKQVSEDNLTDFTIHGVTEEGTIANTWSAASDMHHMAVYETGETPDSDGFELESAEEEPQR